MKVKEVMNKAFAIDYDTSLKEAAKIMGSRDIGSLVVVDADKIIGILTERDIIKNITRLERKISAIMTNQIVTVNSEEERDNATILMAKHKIKKLPVLDNRGKLIGILTSTDLIAHSDDLNEDFLFD
jgi:CBS domain-containing protein